METRDYIESGILELYVYGLLSESENREVAKMAGDNKDIADEIASIEKAILNLSTGFSPYLPAENFARIASNLSLEREEIAVAEVKRRANWAAYTGWAAAILLMAGIAYLFMMLNHANMEVVGLDGKNAKLQKNVELLENKNMQTESALAVLRDNKNTMLLLEGKDAAPGAFAKIYWNTENQTVFIDAAGLPEPPQDSVYQVWSMKFKPEFAPESIGLLENFNAGNHKIFTVSNVDESDGFAVTLEPAGGSETPSMDRLYVLGKM